MEHCVPLARRPRRHSILHALEAHDDGWVEDDAAPTVSPDGKVIDFVSAPVGDRQANSLRGLGLVAEDAWAAALIAQHRLTVYDRFRPDPEWMLFFAEVQEALDGFLRASGGSAEELVVDYPFLRIGDLLSLAFCTGRPEEHRFGKWAVRLCGTRAMVTPDVFDGAEIPMEVKAMESAAKRFRRTRRSVTR